MISRVASALLFAAAAFGCAADAPPRSVAEELKASLADAQRRVDADPNDVRGWLDRGDASFFLGKFDEAVRDYDRMIELAPESGPTHWQRGLALHFAGRYDDAAKQFEKFYELDQSDRENGIWRFYAQVESVGVEEARKRLFPYVQPDREPLPQIYRMCEGAVTAGEVLKSVEIAKVPAEEQAKRRFYADLYTGLDAAIVRDDAQAARPLLDRAIQSKWPRESGYGPAFMWHVARLSRDRLDAPATKP